MAVLAIDHAPGAARTLLGAATLSGQTVTSNQPVINVAQTWNNAGVVFSAVRVNAITTAMASGSLLMHLQANGATKFTVDFAGGLYNSSDAYHFGDVYLTTTNPRVRMGAAGDARMGRSGSGAFTFDNNGANAFTLTAGPNGVAAFGGPVRTAQATVSALPSASGAGAGARALATDAASTTFNSELSGGGSNVVPVFSDGSVWRVG